MMQFSPTLLSTNLPILLLSSKWLTHNHLLHSIRVSSFILYLQIITTPMPNLLQVGRLLVLDLLSVHLIRNINGSTLISFHPSLNLPTTTALFLQERIRFAGELVSITAFLFCWKLWNFRSQRVLANYFPKIVGPNICPADICLACHVCLGWSSRESLRACPLLGKFKTQGYPNNNSHRCKCL